MCLLFVLFTPKLKHLPLDGSKASLSCVHLKYPHQRQHQQVLLWFDGNFSLSVCALPYTKMFDKMMKNILKLYLLLRTQGYPSEAILVNTYLMEWNINPPKLFLKKEHLLARYKIN